MTAQQRMHHVQVCALHAHGAEKDMYNAFRVLPMTHV